jgi:hypothetical protein
MPMKKIHRKYLGQRRDPSIVNDADLFSTSFRSSVGKKRPFISTETDLDLWHPTLGYGFHIQR